MSASSESNDRDQGTVTSWYTESERFYKGDGLSEGQLLSWWHCLLRCWSPVARLETNQQTAFQEVIRSPKPLSLIIRLWVSR